MTPEWCSPRYGGGSCQTQDTTAPGAHMERHKQTAPARLSPGAWPCFISHEDAGMCLKDQELHHGKNETVRVKALGTKSCRSLLRSWAHTVLDNTDLCFPSPLPPCLKQLSIQRLCHYPLVARPQVCRATGCPPLPAGDRGGGAGGGTVQPQSAAFSLLRARWV